MIEIALFLLYLFLCILAISRIPFFTKAGLSKWVLPLLFIIKIGAGFAYAFFYKQQRYYQGSDTWRFYRQSLEETKWLKFDPWAFTKDLFTHGYSRTGNVFSGHDSYWNDLKSNIPIKLLAVMNVITFNSYYVAIVLFNMLFFFGLVALYRIMASEWKTDWKIPVIAIFLLPSTLFWCSGIHKDGLLLSASGLAIFFFYKMIKDGVTVGRMLLVVTFVVIIFLLRSYVALALLPALLAWWISYKVPANKWKIWTGIYTAGIVLFFLAPLIVPTADFPGFIVNKQQEFKQLEGGSALEVVNLEPNFISFLRYLPSALDIAFLRPAPSEIKNLSYLPAILENAAIIFLVIYCIINYRRIRFSPTALFLLLFAISFLMVAGYTITFSGAIVRYRSFALPFLVGSLVMLLYGKLSYSKK